MASVLAVIPARGGSKGVPRKNVQDAGGKPLIAWTIEAALNSHRVNRVVVSTDDREINSVALRYACAAPFVRPADLATDEATTMDVVRHVLHEIPGFDYIALLQPTSPLRTASDIDSAFDLMISVEAPACASVCAAVEPPYWQYEVDNAMRLRQVVAPPFGACRRQELPQTYLLNGAVYIAERRWLLEKGAFVTNETIGYVMPRERSLDIDSWKELEEFRNIFFEADNG